MTEEEERLVEAACFAVERLLQPTTGSASSTSLADLVRKGLDKGLIKPTTDYTPPGVK